MKIAVMGAGALGCYYGGMLAQAGHDVTLIGRRQHVDAMRRHGLILDKNVSNSHIPVLATTRPHAVREAELVLFCAKSTDTLSAGQAMATHLAPSATILSLQNGVDNAERLKSLLAHEVIPAVVYAAVEMISYGHVKHHALGELIIGVSANSARFATLFAEAGIPTKISDNITGALWAKLIVNCAWNALSAIVQQPYGALSRVPGVHEVMFDVVQECLAVAQKMEISVPDGIWNSVKQIADNGKATGSSSMAKDVARGRPTEIHGLNGYVVQKGQELGVTTPANNVLYTLVKLMETGNPHLPNHVFD